MSEHNCDGWDSCPNPAHRPMSLTDFLLARIAEDEWAARLGQHDPEPNSHGSWDGRRVIAECEAKRRIVRRHSSCDDTSFGEPCPDLRDLALPYADHPDYREEWRP